MKNIEQDVDRTFADYLEILQRRRLLLAAVAVVVFGAFVAYAFVSKPVYRATTLIDVERPTDVIADNGYQAPDDEYLPTQAKIIGSDSALRRVYDSLALAQTKEFPRFASFRRAINVLPIPRTRLCEVDVESQDPERATAVADALARDYVKQNQNNQLFMPKAVLAQLEARARTAGGRKFFETLPIVENDAAVRDIETDMVRAEADLAKLRATFTDNHPQVVALKNQLAMLQAAKNREVDRLVRTFRSELSGQFKPNNVRVVDPARLPERPVRPNKPLALALGLLGGLGLGILAALGA